MPNPSSPWGQVVVAKAGWQIRVAIPTMLEPTKAHDFLTAFQGPNTVFQSVTPNCLPAAKCGVTRGEVATEQPNKGWALKPGAASGLLHDPNEIKTFSTFESCAVCDRHCLYESLCLAL